MTIETLSPPVTPAKELVQSLRTNGYVVVSAETVAQIAKTSLSELLALNVFWNDLPRDPYLKDGGRYRYRRHASYEIKGDALLAVPHRAHWQSVDYNALHGGIERRFEPIQAQLASSPAWQSLLLGMAHVLSSLKPVTTWFVEAHEF